MEKYKHSFSEPIGFALVRRVLPETFANKIVGVQPMKPPLSVTTMPFRYVKENPIPEFDKIGEREHPEATEEEKQKWKARKAKIMNDLFRGK